VYCYEAWSPDPTLNLAVILTVYELPLQPVHIMTFLTVELTW